MLKIRLKRVGRKHDPSFRVVVTESTRGPKSGNYVENLGNYDSRKNVKQINAERVKYWISKGAQVSDTVHNILVSKGIIKGKKKDVMSRKKSKKTKDKPKKAKIEIKPEIILETETEKKEENV